ncbi:MAG TPA: sugar ABC transporter ATP-binding protein [Spirochaetes bacterium]|nr:sugar ABC transporter ATP-binding protein [Spirochaetota bacterium]
MGQSVRKQILKAVGIKKTYPGVTALDNVDFDLYEGEVHCLVGKNGAGKSTLIEIISGSINSDKGKLEIFDREYENLTPLNSMSLGIQTVHQTNQLIEGMTVAENIFIGDLKTNRAKFFSLNDCVKATKEIFDFIDINMEPKKLVSGLSLVERKILCIARAFSKKVKILILDEPTASLDKEVEDKLFKVIKNIKARGVGIVYISHNIGEIFTLGDRVTVFRDGRKIATHFIEDIDEKKVIDDMIGTKPREFYRERQIAVDEKLEIRNYSREGYVNKVSFEVKKGEIFGIGGLVGSGRTELVRLIFGVDKKDSGELFYKGKNITPKSPVDAIKKGIGLLTENRRKNGLMVEAPIYENISLVKLIKSTGAFLKLKKEKKETEHTANQINIVTPSIKQIVKNLSGGNQQKVVFAKWMLANADILILDEPTIGIDIGAKAEIYSLMNELSKQGKIVIMITSDNPELVSVSDRIGIMRKGRMVKILEDDNMTEANVLSFALGSTI